ncbi:PLP-dependent aminotransferase family protein [Chondromyces crocatus]|uniref:Transcriptional regulator n=1 Tax=Chondromyces crocatus TaxID=52 RepID=A0A0K1EG02_CHOCO|nr:PLP-dependent aminotransferase family protein [Chondromyces crocatus]AKT39513.1 transcriptional regulator [Chondromyces crocatus]
MDVRIDQLMRTGAAAPGIITLGGGLPAPELFPRRALMASFQRVMMDPSGAALQYGWPEGSEGLRGWIAERLRRRGADVSASDVIITSGAQQALAVASQVLFQRGDRVGCEPESYPGALDLFGTRGVLPVVGHDDVRALYVMPAVSNPHGRAMTTTDRRRWLDHAHAAQLPLLEDDAYAELRFDGPPHRPLLADARHLVWHIGTLSKTLCPGLRVGWLVAPPVMYRRALEAKQALDLQANSLALALLEDFLGRHDYDALVARARRFYHRRALHLAATLSRRLPSFRFTAPEGGFTLWAETDCDGDDRDLLEFALQHGVSFDPGRSFRVDLRSSRIALRLSFATESSARQDEGVARLARAWDMWRGRTPRVQNDDAAARTPVVA